MPHYRYCVATHLLGAGLLAAAGAASAADPGARAGITPVWDVHQHSMSSAAKDLIVPHAELPAVVVPPVLDKLLRAREAVSGSPPVGPVFTNDAIILEHQEGRWWQGRARIDRFINHWPRNVAFIPRHYALGGDAGYVAGGIRVDNSWDCDAMPKVNCRSPRR